MKTVIALSAALLAACSVRRPAYVAVPRAQSRSQEPVALPLDPQGRQRLEDFLSHGGHPTAPGRVPDPLAAQHRRTLDALENSAVLDVDTADSSARRFCAVAAKLCRETELFRGRPFVRQVVDARESGRPVTAPIAVPDGPYWWIFKVEDGRLIEILLVCPVERSKP
jgi:hypothetical protein